MSESKVSESDTKFWSLSKSQVFGGVIPIVVETRWICIHLIPGYLIICPPDGPHSKYWYEKDSGIGGWMKFNLDVLHTEAFHVPTMHGKALERLSILGITFKCAHKHQDAKEYRFRNTKEYVSYYDSNLNGIKIPKWFSKGEMFPDSPRGKWVIANEKNGNIHLKGDMVDINKLERLLLFFFCDKSHKLFADDEIRWLKALISSYPFSVFSETMLPNFLRRVLSLQIKWDSDSVEGQFPDDSIDRLFRLFLVRNKLIACDKTDSFYSKARQVLQCPLHELVYELYKLEPQSLFRFVKDLYDILPIVIWGVISEYMDPYHVFWELIANYFSSL